MLGLWGGEGKKATVHNQRRHSRKNYRMKNYIKTQERLLCLDMFKAFRMVEVAIMRLRGGGSTGEEGW